MTFPFRYYFLTFVFPSCESVKRLLGTKRMRLEEAAVVGSQESGVVTSVCQQLFEGKDEAVTTARADGQRRSVELPAGLLTRITHNHTNTGNKVRTNPLRP